MKSECIVARIQLMERDGHVHAFSDEVPGLNVCGIDRDTVLGDVIPAIEFLFREVRGLKVKVSWTPTESKLLPPARTKEFRDLTLVAA